MRILNRLSLLSASVIGLAAAGVALPQSVSAQAVVQPLPPREAADLNDALRRLARSPRDLGALLDAGEASVQVGDIDAAIGFFARAQDIAPDNGRAMLGLARCFTLQRQPIEALRLYAEAENAGIPEAAMAADRGLAFDLVGDNASAQALYRAALAQGNDPETRRRLALSLAMTGNRQEFEATLLPLLESEDRSAFRARAFGLAILGDADDAVGIAEALMPTDLALRMAPYLRYMPRLTRAQQAPMGSNAAPAAAPVPTPAPARQTRQQRRQAERAARRAAGSDPMDRTLVRSAPAPAPVPAPAPAPAPLPAPAPPPSPAPSPAPSAQSDAPAIQFELPPASAPASQEATQVARIDPSQVDPDESATQLITAENPVQVAVLNPADNAENMGPAAPTTPAPAPDPEPSQSVADAFAAFAATQPVSAPRPANAVDITTIEPPRERAEPPPPKPEAKPKPPANPSRHYVQIATGRDRDALKFDWRRIARKADSLLDGKGPFVTKWVEANRLLAGPYPSKDAAREVMNKLKAMGIDSFTFTSDSGQAIDPLD